MAYVPSKVLLEAKTLLRSAEAMWLSEEVLAGSGQHLTPQSAIEPLEALIQAHPELELVARVAQLKAVGTSKEKRTRYIERFGACGVQRFKPNADTTLYQLQVQTFPTLLNNVMLILEPGHTILFDVGSGSDASRRDIDLGFAIVRDLFGEDVHLTQLDTAIISHAHIDHFGGVKYIADNSSAKICVHELDARVIANFEERVVIATKDVDIYLSRAGVDQATRTELLKMYGNSRHWFKSQRVDRTLRDGDLVGHGHRVIHVPGHCPGLICLQVGDILLTSDHVLDRITPHQFPQAITPYAGLEHYLESLIKVRQLEGINLALGGHEAPIADLRTRIDEIDAFHRERLRAVLQACKQPKSIRDVSRELFGAREHYDRLLAIEEAGAHVEYLYARGQLRIANLDEVAQAGDPVIQYVAH